MTRHVAWAADEFLLEKGFVIADPGPGQMRRATRGDLAFELEPRCRCDWCPAPNHSNYRVAAAATA